MKAKRKTVRQKREAWMLSNLDMLTAREREALPKFMPPDNRTGVIETDLAGLNDKEIKILSELMERTILGHAEYQNTVDALNAL